MLGAFVFISDHRAHRHVLLQQQFGDSASDPTDAAYRAGPEWNLFFLPYVHLNQEPDLFMREGQNRSAS